MTNLVFLCLFPLYALAVVEIPSPDNSLHVYALPIGQGDATVVQCPAQAGGGLIVVDIGSRKFRGFMNRQDVSNWFSDQTVDAILLTHPDEDHYNFLDALANNVPQGINLYHTCDIANYVRLPQRVSGWNANFIRVTTCVADDKNCNSSLPPCQDYSICDRQAILRILAAELNGCTNNGENEDSMVVKLVHRGQSIILFGDLEDPTVNANIAGTPQLNPGGPYETLLACADVHSTMMRLAHHGAYGRANKPDLLSAVNPVFIFSSSGFRFLHPRCDIYFLFLAWLAAAGNPGVPALNLQSNPGTSHRYTCGDSSQQVYSSAVIPQEVYVTSVCDLFGVNTLKNFIITLTITSIGQPQIEQTQFNSFTAATYPGSFPC